MLSRPFIVHHRIDDKTNIHSYNDLFFLNSIVTYSNVMFPLDVQKTFHCYESRVQSRTIKNNMELLKTGFIMKSLQHGHNQYYKRDDGIAPITGMNEIYISVLGGGGSDDVFETAHVDGPFFFLPCCKIYRCIVAATANRAIATVFPVAAEKYTLTKGDFLAFDYNRDLHYIVTNTDKRTATATTTATPENRIVLKFHYITYPRWLSPLAVEICKIMHVAYNSTTRFLFLNSQRSNNKWLSEMIQYGTVVFGQFMSGRSREK